MIKHTDVTNSGHSFQADLMLLTMLHRFASCFFGPHCKHSQMLWRSVPTIEFAMHEQISGQ